MHELFQAARDLQSFFQDHGWEFCFIGGLAVWRWGKPRFTQDIDVYAHLNPLAELKEEPELVSRLRSLESKWAKRPTK